ncbi:hypothetical protein GGR56DRAFT_637741 [Xylariaceae sp. FL0804]|nr:hypothetical protein GGR56DRAFT_637741 [Xylariaceae sp. FL0804]
MVSTISDDPPMLNWIYVDRATHEVKYGLRADAQAHITGPFDCTRQDRRLTLQGWEGFVAVEELPGTWALYFDADDDGLGAKVPMGTRVLEVELTRREKKERRPQPDPSQAQTLDEMMRQHKEQSRREEEERQRDLGSDELGGQQNTVEETTRWQPDADAPPPEQQSAARPQPEIEQDLGRLNIGAGVSPEHSPIAVFSPSVATDSMSFWSRAREAGDGDDLASVTAASSVGERGGQARPEPTTPPGEPGYKQPEPSTPPGEPGYKQAEPNTPPREEPGFGRSKPTTAPGEPGYRRPYVEDEMPEEQAEDSVNEGGV